MATPAQILRGTFISEMGLKDCKLEIDHEFDFFPLSEVVRFSSSQAQQPVEFLQQKNDCIRTVANSLNTIFSRFFMRSYPASRVNKRSEK